MGGVIFWWVRRVCGWVYSGLELRKVFVSVNGWSVKVGATQWKKGQRGDTDHEMAGWGASHCQETTRSIVGIIQTPGSRELEQARAGGGRCCYLELILAYLHMRTVGQSLHRLMVQRWLEPWKLYLVEMKIINRYEVHTLKTQPMAGLRLPTPAWSNCLQGAISRGKTDNSGPIWSSPM